MGEKCSDCGQKWKRRLYYRRAFYRDAISSGRRFPRAIFDRVIRSRFSCRPGFTCHRAGGITAWLNACRRYAFIARCYSLSLFLSLLSFSLSFSSSRYLCLSPCLCTCWGLFNFRPQQVTFQSAVFQPVKLIQLFGLSDICDFFEKLLL